jgi:riboflavin kinase/FMN adenylyltransferase
MRHVQSLEEAALVHPSVVTIGVFDGVHQGHRHLINQFVRHAEAFDLVPVVLTFFPYPDTILHGLKQGYYLTMPDFKAQLLAQIGVKVVVTHPFDDAVRHMRAVKFVDRLTQYLRMQSLWVGADFAMGYRREGNVEFLSKESSKRGFDLKVVDLMDAGSEHVSSTRIRQALAEGDLDMATRLLGRPHQIAGSVVEGAGRGRTLGIATANLSLPLEQAIPARGVYAAWALVDGQEVPAVVNIGLRPTFDGTGDLTVEAHLLDFSADLYGQTISLKFISRLRDEHKFANVQALLDQIHRDIARARTLLTDSC